MTEAITLVEESAAEENILETGLKTKSILKLDKKINKKRKKRRSKVLIKDVLGDFSTQTGSYF